MALKVLRALFVLACVIMGVIWASYLLPDQYPRQYFWIGAGGVIGLLVSLAVIVMVTFVSQEMFERISPAVVAIVLAIAVGWGVARYILLMFPNLAANQYFSTFLVTSLVLIFAFIGITLGLTRASNWEALVKAVRRRHLESRGMKLLDTSVIIDGRLADVCKTGFLEGTLVVPRFILRELQSIADSPDVLRRARGRRGLDILRQLQESDSGVEVQVIEDDPLDVHEVDGKLVRLARQFGAKIVTNDLNLNKVAQIEKVLVLNINDLANSLKPAVLPDEQMHVKIVKEGKEAFQGVGYLDDGTMVVVDGGRDHVGKDVAVVVTSVLQTTAGRMIFTKLQQILS
jgi:uncharacterized protein YacL